MSKKSKNGKLSNSTKPAEQKQVNEAFTEMTEMRQENHNELVNYLKKVEEVEEAELLAELSNFNVSVKVKSANIMVNTFQPSLIQLARFELYNRPLTFQELKVKLVQYHALIKVKSGKDLKETYKGALITALNMAFLSIEACQGNKGERDIYKGVNVISAGQKLEVQNGIEVLAEIRSFSAAGEKLLAELSKVGTFLTLKGF